MRITELYPQPDWVLSVVADDGRFGSCDVTPYFEYEAFEKLRNSDEFTKVSNIADTLSSGSVALICPHTIDVR